MMIELEERLVVAFEGIAEALKGMDETQRQQFQKQWPDPKERRDAIISRVPNEEDLIHEAHGQSDEPIEEWIGLREQEYLREHKQPDAGAQEPAASGPPGGSPEAVESEPDSSRESPADQLDVQES